MPRCEKLDSVDKKCNINITNARKDLYRIVKSVNESHQPVHIVSKNGAAVLIGEEDWRNIEETLYLLSIKGMRGSIVEGLKVPVDELETE